MKEQGWKYDWEYDWWKAGERGTLIPDEYHLNMRFVEPAIFECNSVLSITVESSYYLMTSLDDDLSTISVTSTS